MYAQALYIVKKLQSEGHTAVIAGGAPRDSFLGKVPKDYDIATSATAEQIKKSFDSTIPVGEKFGVIVVVIEDKQIQVATLRKDGVYFDGRRPETVSFTTSLKKDSERRDFTCNSMFYDPIKDKVYDFFNGFEDIRKGIIRTVGDPEERFNEDKLRLMRLVRFAAKLGFKIENKTYDTAKKLAKSITEVSWERIREEFFKIILYKNGIRILDELNILQEILPEVTKLKEIPGDPVHHPEGNVFIHSVGVAESLRIETEDPFLVFIGLLHDTGKAINHETYKDVTGRIRHTHNGHDKSGAEITEAVLKRFKFSSNEILKGKELVRQHMRAHKGKEMRRSVLLELLRNPYIGDLIELQQADSDNSAHKSKGLKEFYLERRKNLSRAIKSTFLITGNDLISLGYKQGPIFSEILSAVRKAQDDKEIKNPKEAIKFVKEKFKNV